jgi:hypothetical protein
MMQRFEFPLVEHLLRSSRGHTYRSIRFRWTHCENPRFGSDGLHRSDRWRVFSPKCCFLLVFQHISILGCRLII